MGLPGTNSDAVGFHNMGIGHWAGNFFKKETFSKILSAS